jgi:choline-sulfatase
MKYRSNTRSASLHFCLLLTALTLSCNRPEAVSGESLAEHDSARPANLLVVTVDTLRSDALGCYGSTSGNTPNFDGLAKDGVVFERSYAPIATTFPSHASMFTGVYPREHGVRWNGQSLDDEWTTLAELLSDRGYSTGAFVSYKAMVNRGGLGQGFSEVSDPDPAKKWDGARPGDETVAMATDWLARQHEGPFMLWVHLFEPHSPYPVTEHSAQAMGDYSGPFSNGITAEEFSDLPKGWTKDPLEREALRALYDGRVRDADRQVGQLLDSLDELGVRDDTLVVLLGDHGQLLGEHRQVGHGPVLHEEVLKTPFIIDEPGSRRGPGRVTDLVGVIDLTPTVLELLSLPALDDVDGRSLVPLLGGQSSSGEPYFAEVRVTGVKGTGSVDATDDPVAVLRGQYKLVMTSKGVTIFDLRQDPGETSPLTVDDLPGVGQELLVLARKHQHLRPGQNVAHASEQLDEETLAELKALGYLK